MPTRSPKAFLIQKIELLCTRLVPGSAADQRWQVWVHVVLRIASIILTSLGGAGFIADKVSPNLPGQTGWAFWGGLILLAFGILTQVANELGVERVASEAKTAAENFKLLAIRLDLILEEDDPTNSVGNLQKEVQAAIQKYHRVIPGETPETQATARAVAQSLVKKHQGHWKFPS